MQRQPTHEKPGRKPVFRLHQWIAVIVLAVSAVWVVTGEFSSIGSESNAEAATGVPEQSGQAAPQAVIAAVQTVAVIPPVFIEYAREIQVSGVTEPDKRATLSARTDGVIASIEVAEGETVTAGQIILAINRPEVKASVLTAEALLHQRQREADNAEALYKRGSIPEIQVEAARAALAAAEAQLSQAIAEVDKLQVVAPFAGLVDSLSVEPGNWVQTGNGIGVLLALDPVIARAEISEIHIALVQIGARAVVRLVSGAVVEGKVRHIGREASPATRTYPIEVEIANKDLAIPAGMTAEVTLFAAPDRAVVVPRSVITLSADGDLGLRVVKNDNIAQFAPVTLIDDTPEGIVLTGVPQDVRIIVAGQDLVSDGELVHAVEAGLGGVLK